MSKNWVALFSQTGSEILQISKKIGRFPDKILTTKSFTELDSINTELLEQTPGILFHVPKKPCTYVYRSFLNPNDIITLNGWLRIVPPDICKVYNIYNGHPGLITEYPELKGKDPQKRAASGTYDKIGCVIHKVMPVVDAGEIILSDSIKKLVSMTEEDIINILHDMSVNLWVKFLKDNL